MAELPAAVGHSNPSGSIALFSLACIFAGRLKRWAFEIVGWAILEVFILAAGMG